MCLKLISRMLATAILCLSISACQTTKVVKTWQSDKDVSRPEKVAVLVMAADALRRLEAERSLAKHLRSSGTNAFASSEIKGMRGRLTREKAAAALEAGNFDGVIVIFLLGALQSEALERADYYARYEGTGVAYNWMTPRYASPTMVSVYSVQEGSGYADYSVDVYLETTYIDMNTGEPVWNMVTSTQDPEYRDVAGAIAGMVSSQMKKAGLH
jgi:hypothetical protein